MESDSSLYSEPDYGYFVDSDDEAEVDDLEANAEEVVYYYHSPSYFPICIGMVLARRYRIEHKLGHGGFSTVWMAYDTIGKKDVALKIPTLSSDTADNELAINNEIRNRVQDSSGLLLAYDSFAVSFPGSDRRHTVLVFPMQGCNLNSSFASLSMAHRMSAAKQVLQGLKNLHEAGIIHRDLNDKKVLCGIVPLDGYDTKEKYQYLGRPKKMFLEPPKGPAELVKRAVFPTALLNGCFYLADFGMATRAGTEVNHKPQTPRGFCAPERLHNANPTAASDMWSYMCLFMELYLGHLPFYRNGLELAHAPVSRGGIVLAHTVNALGPLPQVWYRRYHEPGSNEASWYGQGTRPAGRLESMISRARPDITADEAAHVLSVMLAVFRYEPRERLTAAQLLSNTSFQAIMSLYGA